MHGLHSNMQTHIRTHTQTGRRLLVGPLVLPVIGVGVPPVVGRASVVAAVLASIAALLALFTLVVVLVDDLHLQAADVEGYGAQPEKTHAAHHGALDQQGGHGEQHQPPQGQEAAHVGGAAEGHAGAAQDEEGCGKIHVVLLHGSK